MALFISADYRQKSFPTLYARDFAALRWLGAAAGVFFLEVRRCWAFWGYTIRCGVLFGVFEAANGAARPVAMARGATIEERGRDDKR